VVEDVVVTGLLVAGVRPPVREALPRRRDRRRQKDEEIDGNANAHERRRKPAERVAHDHNSAAVADRLDDGLGVLLPTGRLVLAGEVDGDRVVPVLAQRGRNQVPIPRASTTPWMSANVATAATLSEVPPANTRLRLLEAIAQAGRKPGTPVVVPGDLGAVAV
jgi:hypothetical protein